MRRLLLDTSVWRRCARERGGWRRLAACSAPLVATDEVAQEIVVAALATSSGDEYEELRLAARLVSRYASRVLPPFEYVLAEELKLVPKGALAPEPSSVLRVLAENRHQREFLDVAAEGVSSGPGYDAQIGRWRRIMAGEKERWASSLRNALEAAAPGLVSARVDRTPQAIDALTLTQLRTQLWSDRAALAELELVEVERLLALPPPGPSADASCVARVQALLTTHTHVLAEVLLDRFDHPENANRRKARLEGNDAYDVGQLRYLRERDVWVTEERLWPAIAQGAGVPHAVLHSDVALPLAKR